MDALGFCEWESLAQGPQRGSGLQGLAGVSHWAWMSVAKPLSVHL